MSSWFVPLLIETAFLSFKLVNEFGRTAPVIVVAVERRVPDTSILMKAGRATLYSVRNQFEFMPVDRSWANTRLSAIYRSIPSGAPLQAIRLLENLDRRTVSCLVGNSGTVVTISISTKANCLARR